MKTSHQIGTINGFGGRQLKEMQFTNPGCVMLAHACLTPKFSITLRIRELRKLITGMKSDDIITVTVTDGKAPTYTFVR